MSAWSATVTCYISLKLASSHRKMCTLGSNYFITRLRTENLIEKEVAIVGKRTHTILIIPDRLIRRNQANSGEPGASATNVV